MIPLKSLRVICRPQLSISILKSRMLIKDIEAAAELHLISLLPTELQESFAPYLDSEQFSPEEKHIVKQADLICAYIKAQFELEHGNHEFKTAKKTLRKFNETMAQPRNGLFFTGLFAEFWAFD